MDFLTRPWPRGSMSPSSRISSITSFLHDSSESSIYAASMACEDEMLSLAKMPLILSLLAYSKAVLFSSKFIIGLSFFFV